MVFAKCDGDETGIRPAFCYSGAALHSNWRTPASSLIHDLPLRKKCALQKIISFFFYSFFSKKGMRSNPISSLVCIRTFRKVENCCQVAKAFAPWTERHQWRECQTPPSPWRPPLVARCFATDPSAHWGRSACPLYCRGMPGCWQGMQRTQSWEWRGIHQ